MRKLLLTVVAMLAWAVPAVADDGKPDPVVVTARVRSLLDLTGYAEYLGGLVGQGDPAKQAAQLVRGLADPDKGIEGIDPARPIGAYGVLTPDAVNSYAVVVLPVADETAVMELLAGRLNLEPKKGKGGVYELKVPNVPVPVFFRFANKSAYITARSADPLADEKLIAPAVLFAEKEEAVAVVKLFPDRVPMPLRRVGLGLLELQLAQQAKDKVNGSKPATAQAAPNEWGQRVGQQAGFAVLKALALEASEVAARVGIDPASDELSTEIVVTPKAGTYLAKLIGGEVGLTGAAGRVRPQDAFATAGVRFDLPRGVQKELDAGVDALIDRFAERQTDRKLLGALAPTLKSRVVDVRLVVTGDGPGSIRAVAELRVKDGAGIAKALKEVDAADPAPNAKPEFDVGAVNGVALHRVTLPDAGDLEKTFGSRVVWIGTADERLLVSVGPDLTLLKRMIRAERGQVPAVAIDVSAARLLKLASDKLPREKVDKLVAGTDGNDGVRLAVTGGEAAKIRLTVKGRAVSLATAFDKASKDAEK